MDNRVKFIFLALLTGGAVVLSVIESMIPLPFIAPGAKLGLANMIVLSVIVLYGFKSAIFVSVLRCFLLLIIASNPISFIYSISGAIFSVAIMSFIYKYFSKVFSLVGVSIFGAISHNLAQIIIASIIMENIRIFSYFPIMCIVSLFTGCFVGYVTIFIVKNLKMYIK